MRSLSAKDLFDGLVSGRYDDSLKDDPKWMINGLTERRAAYERFAIYQKVIKQKLHLTGEELHNALRRGAFSGFGYKDLLSDPLWNDPENKDARKWAWERRTNPSFTESLSSAVEDLLLKLGDDLIDATSERCDAPQTFTVVIDPGHGGDKKVGASSPNNATSFSGVLEKQMTLELGLLVRDAFSREDVRLFALQRCVKVNPVLTRSTDVNVGLADRASVAKKNGAKLFLSLHFNGWDGVKRGIESFVLLNELNVNTTDDKHFAKNILDSAYWTLMMFDKSMHYRGVKEQELGVLDDVALGTKVNGCRACLLEVEFIDAKAADNLFNISAKAMELKETLARSLAIAIVVELSLL